ncbi:hypothetical protein [Streptomyces sp. NPDC003032]
MAEDERGHGRTERRTIRTATADDALFPGAGQVFRLRRDSGGLDGTWTGREIVFGVTSLPAHLVGPYHFKHYEGPLVHRKQDPLGAARHLLRGQPPGQGQHRTPSPGQLP